ncbi:MAG: LysM peptidoglycan-binding domain-containing protein [Firmicutes bacterium]|nr:LysM peptidoglycan-binding domain-containing protein [Bacillota bacterium]MDD4708207.1 LysM peptidoglycan-binding domain-containing protein [Bacillota bacterium]
MGKIKRIVLIGVVALSVTAASGGVALASSVHIVSPGDTYWKISQWYGVDLTVLLDANGANGSSILYAGQSVTIPGKGSGYIVKAGDTYWKISQKMNVDMNELLTLNGANIGSVLYKGQSIKLPSSVKSHNVKRGETFWIISNAYGISTQSLMKANDASAGTILYPGMVMFIPTGSGSGFVPPSGGNGQAPPPKGEQQAPPSGDKPYITYTTHTVQSGDDFWSLGIKYGVPYREILDANGLKENTIIYVGQKLKIPVHHVPVKLTPGAKYGELLDWWSEAQYVWPIGTDAKITDFYTGISWNARRTVGANHADVEPLTVQDTNTMKNVWGGSWSWGTRPVIVEVKGRKIAASASAMPHDVQYIQNNGFNGHFDVHFYNSTRHVDGQPSQNHQRDVKFAAGK